MGANADEKSTKKTKRARLGRGLSALVDHAPGVQIDLNDQAAHATHTGQSTNTKPPIQSIDEHERVHEIPLGEIRPNPHQPRRDFDEESLRSLADSIRAHGVMQPIVVRRAGNGGGFELIAGERRLRAAKLAELSTIRAVLDSADDNRSAELALIENIQRADLNPIERAMGLRQLLDRFGSTQQELADRMGMSRSGLANLLRLLELEEQLQQWVAEGKLSTGQAKVLLSCDDAARRGTLATQCIEQEWTVRQLESQCARGEEHPTPVESQTVPADEPTGTRVESVLRDLERRLSEQLGTRVSLRTNTTGTRGRVIIEFYDLDQFDGLLSRMGVVNEPD